MSMKYWYQSTCLRHSSSSSVHSPPSPPPPPAPASAPCFPGERGLPKCARIYQYCQNLCKKLCHPVDPAADASCSASSSPPLSRGWGPEWEPQPEKNRKSSFECSWNLLRFYILSSLPLKLKPGNFWSFLVPPRPFWFHLDHSGPRFIYWVQKEPD